MDSGYIMQAYDDALRLILDKGVWKENRTGVRTKAVFGIMSRYDISERFPLVTGRKIPSRSVFGELLWFISGSTNNQDLQKMGVNIWTPWVDEAFERKHGYAPGCLGPVYGFQLRHFGGQYGNGIGGFSGISYANMAAEKPEDWTDEGRKKLVDEGRTKDYFVDTERAPSPRKGNWYGSGGVDQLAYIIKLLKENPNDRRIIFSLWNPAQLEQMRLPPCHLYFQLFVHDGKLSGMMIQRSCDFPVGVPFNIAFYSALIYMLAQQTGFTPDEFVHVTNDSHVYEDQIPAIEEYLARPKPESPRLKLHKATDIYSYILEDFELADYAPLEAIKIPVAV